MKLTPEQTEEAAETLYTASGRDSGKNTVPWEDCPEDYKKGMRKIVTDCAGLLDVEESPEAVMVFMYWMGKDVPKKFRPPPEVLAAMERVDVNLLPGLPNDPKYH